MVAGDVDGGGTDHGGRSIEKKTVGIDAHPTGSTAGMHAGAPTTAAVPTMEVRTLT